MARWQRTSLHTTDPSSDMTSAESIPIGLRFTARLGSGESVASSPAPVVTLRNLDTGEDVSETSLDGSPSVSSPIVTQMVTALQRGSDYELAATAAIAGASPARTETVLHVIECVA